MLQNALGAFHQLAFLQLLRQEMVFAFQSRHFDFGPYQKSQRREQANFLRAVRMRGPMLQVDDADQSPPAQDRNRQEGFKPVFRQLIKPLKPGIFVSLLSNCRGLATGAVYTGDYSPSSASAA